MSNHDQHDDHHDDDHHNDAHGHKHANGLGSCGSRDHSRRAFLKGAAASSVALLGSSYGIPDLTFAQTAGKKTIIKIFMRGGADGLSLMPKFGDVNYRILRPDIGIPVPSADPNSAIRLDNMYGLNPNLRPLMEIWDTGRMAIGPGVHFAEGNRSHFDCQQWIELGERRDVGDGLFNKYLQLNAGNDPLRALRAGSNNMAASLAGTIIVPAISNGTDYNLTNSDWCGGNNCSDNGLTKALEQLGAVANQGPEIERETRRTSKIMVETIAKVQAASINYTPSANGMLYLDGDGGRRFTTMGRGLKLAAQLLKSGAPLEIAAIDWSGHWDTHENQIGSSIIDETNSHARSLREGADNLVTFWRDLGALRDNVIVMVGSEFGRTALQNGSKGTDHGRGSVWFALGGPTVGGIYAPLPELTEQLVRNSPNNNSVPITMNYKDMLAEAMIRHLNVPDSQIATLFPGHTFTNYNMFTRSV